jgi:hypothetical protein
MLQNRKIFGALYYLLDVTECMRSMRLTALPQAFGDEFSLPLLLLHNCLATLIYTDSHAWSPELV